MIARFGMSEKFGLMGLESVENKYLDGRAVLNCGDATAAEIDTEVMAILKKCYEKAKELLAGNREILDKIAAFLVERETITGKEFMEIYNEVKANKNLSEEDKAENGKAVDAEAKNAGPESIELNLDVIQGLDSTESLEHVDSSTTGE